MKRMNFFIFCLIVISIIVLAITIISAPVLNEDPKSRKMKLIKSENWSNFPKDMFKSDIKTDMETGLTAIFSDLSNDSKFHCDLTGDEEYYYYNTTIGYPEDYCDNEYIAIETIDYSGHHESWCGRYSAQTNSWCGDGSYINEYTAGISISGGNVSKNYGTSWQVLHKLGWYITGYGESNTVYTAFNETSNIPRDQSYTYNKSNSGEIDKIISKNIYYDIPSITYNITHSDTWVAGKWPAAWSNYWTNDNTKINWYHARSPRPYIYSQNTLPSLSNPRFINEFGETTVDFEKSVKIINANLYILKNNIYEKMNITISKNIQTENEKKGIKSLTISKEDFKKYIKDEGKYSIVFGVVDKFNKIYIFEPEYLVYDITPPNESKVTGENVINNNYYLTNTNPNFITYQKIDDTYAGEWNNTDFIWVNMNGKSTNILDQSFADTFAVAKNLEDEQTKAIKIIKNNENIVIDEIFLRDKAGNKKTLASNKSYYLKIDKPVVSIENTDKVYTSNDFVKLNIASSTKIKINELKLIYTPGTLEKILRNNEDFTNIKQIDVPLTMLKGKEGNFQIYIDIEDPVGYHNETNTFILKIGSDILEPKLSLNNIIFSEQYAIKNLTQELKIENNNTSFSYFDLTVDSNYSESNNKIYLKNNSNRNMITGTIVTSDSRSSEIINLNITVYDIKGKSINVKKKIELYNDPDAPVITNQLSDTNTVEDLYSITITDKTDIKKVWYKCIDINNNTTIDKTYFNDLDTSIINGWNVFAENIDNSKINNESYNVNLSVLSGKAVCLVAEDRWGHKNHLILKKENSGANFIIIEKKDDLLQFEYNENGGIKSYNVYGNVIFKTNISIETNETLTFKTISGNVSNIYFDDLVDKIKIINNGGVINFDTTGNKLIFKGIKSIRRYYSWFGIQNLNGEMNFAGSNGMEFYNAISPITYRSPQNDINLSNMSFQECITGIHFIDDFNQYNKLNVTNCNFDNLVYGIKFDINSTDNNINLGSLNNYLIRSSCNFTNISKGNIYWPVSGIQD